ncbi:MAG: DUF3887 domain-containing protein [Blautia sp.]|jgi:hypothetical protein
MKKMITLILTTAAILCLFTGCGKGSKLPEGFDEETVKAQAIQDIELAASDDYEGWKARFEDELQPHITEDSYQGHLENLKKHGAFQEYGKYAFVGQEKDGKKYAAIVIIVKYEEGDIQYSVGYDEDMKLVQFTTK